MAKKKSNVLTYTTIGIIILIILGILFTDDILEMMGGNKAPQKSVVDIKPIEDNVVDRLITEAEELGRERRYNEAIAKLDKAKESKTPLPTKEQSDKIDRLMSLFKKEFLALNKKRQEVIEKRIRQARIMGDNKKYKEAITHLKETKTYKDPEPTLLQHDKIDNLITSYSKRPLARKPAVTKKKSFKKALVKKRKKAKAFKKPSSPSKNKAIADKYYNAGRKALSKGQVKKAIRLFAKALSYYPEHTLAHSYKGTAHYMNKQIAKAMDSSNEALKRDPDEPNAHLTKGSVYYDQENDKLAREEFLAVIKTDKNNAMAYYKLGVLALVLPGDENTKREAPLERDAILYFDRAIEIGTLGKKYTRNANYNKGVARERLSEFDDAQKDYEKALELDDSYAKAYVQIVELLYKKSEHDKSLDKINNMALTLSTNEAYIATFIGAKNYDKLSESNVEVDTQRKKAIETYYEAFRIDLKASSPLYNIGRIHFRAKEYRKALDFFEQANKITENDYEINYAIALSYYKLKQENESLAFFNSAKEINSTIKEPYLGLGVIYFQDSNEDNDNLVIENLENVTKIDPNNPVANNILGVLYFNKEDESRAVEHFKRALEGENALKTEASFNTNKNLATALFYNKSYEEAIPYYKDLVSKDRSDSESLLRLGVCYIRTNNKRDAKTTINSLVNTFPEYKKQKNVQFYLKLLEDA